MNFKKTIKTDDWDSHGRSSGEPVSIDFCTVDTGSSQNQPYETHVFYILYFIVCIYIYIYTCVCVCVCVRALGLVWTYYKQRCIQKKSHSVHYYICGDGHCWIEKSELPTFSKTNDHQVAPLKNAGNPNVFLQKIHLPCSINLKRWIEKALK